MALLPDLSGVVLDDTYRYRLIANRKVRVMVLLICNLHNRVGEAPDLVVIFKTKRLLKFTVNFRPRVHGYLKEC